MKADEFSVWFSGVRRLSAGQRREVAAALANWGNGGLGRVGETEASAAGGGRLWRKARGEVVVRMLWERAAMSGWRTQGCPHCAGRAIVAWGGSHGLSRFRCKSCGRTFNALTKTAMAHLHKRERWLDHARAMIEGKACAKTAELCGVHPTTAFRWRHRFLGAPAADKPKKLSGIVEADETFILEILQGPLVRSAAQGA